MTICKHLICMHTLYTLYVSLVAHAVIYTYNNKAPNVNQLYMIRTIRGNGVNYFIFYVASWTFDIYYVKSH